MDDSEDSEVDSMLARRRQQKARSRRIKIRLAVLGGVIIGSALLALLIFKSGRLGGPAPTKEGEQWTATEIRDHLRKNGLKVWIDVFAPYSATSQHRRPGHHAFVFADTETEAKNRLSDAENLSTGTKHIVCFRKAETAEEAREAAGLSPKYMFAWGRYLFWVESTSVDDTRNIDNLSAIHRSLTGKPFRPSP